MDEKEAQLASIKESMDKQSAESIELRSKLVEIKSNQDETQKRMIQVEQQMKLFKSDMANLKIEPLLYLFLIC